MGPRALRVPAWATITLYVGAGVGVDFVDGVSNSASTVFAYQGIVDAGWNFDDTTPRGNRDLVA